MPEQPEDREVLPDAPIDPAQIQLIRLPRE